MFAIQRRPKSDSLNQNILRFALNVVELDQYFNGKKPEKAQAPRPRSLFQLKLEKRHSDDYDAFQQNS